MVNFQNCDIMLESGEREKLKCGSELFCLSHSSLSRLKPLRWQRTWEGMEQSTKKELPLTRKTKMRYQGDSNSQSLPPESNALPLGHGLRSFRYWPMPQEKRILTPSGYDSKIWSFI